MLCYNNKGHEMTIIRSFYFRNEKEVIAVKTLLHDMRVKDKTEPKSEPEKTETMAEKFGIHTIKRAYLPPLVEDILNGGSYPNPEDCTEEERDVLYNPMFQEYYKRYISTKDDKSRGLLRGIIAEFIEHNFPMLEKDTK